MDHDASAASAFPYSAPASLGGDHRWDAVRLGAVLVVVLDIGCALAWRGTTAIAVAYPSLEQLHIGNQATNIVIKLVCGGGLVGAARLLTKPPPTRPSVSPLGQSMRASAVVFVIVQLARFFLSMMRMTLATGMLDVFAHLVNGATLALAGFYLAQLLDEVRVEQPLAGGRLLGLAYFLTSIVSAALAATLWAPAYSSYRFLFPPAARTFVSLIFGALFFASLPLLLRLWRAQPRIGSAMTPLEAKAFLDEAAQLGNRDGEAVRDLQEGRR